jgi:hypothetical protein
MPVPSRRLDDRICILCGKIAASKNPEEWIGLLPELQVAIHEAISRLRFRFLASFDASISQHPERRRAPDSYRPPDDS